MKQSQVGQVPVHYVEHGDGMPLLVLHGAGVDHREVEACFEPALATVGGFRRLYPDLPGMSRTPAPASVASADDVLDTLVGFAADVAGSEPVLLAGHSAGAYYARGFAARQPDAVAGLALVCPLLPEARDIPEHRPVVAADLGDEEFRGYFVQQTPQMLDRYERFVAPAAALVDPDAMERIGARWDLTMPDAAGFDRPVLVVAGRQDSTVGYAAAADLVEEYPQATVAVVDGAGHALPHERPDLLAALLVDWLTRRPLPLRPRRRHDGGPPLHPATLLA
ncbi:alpha/beta hydrolase [Luteipulveratus sp. YIM 133132]|uniref:alpha/beta fold hydrolase n=1 Tax=Luteipulveratus flavus TaxID=3031728 RepID=UPI0023B0E71C|nr:alpha/beta hydrolase [Luteipulveratus sp. YIM 133132]MDE9364795.1 alpha/beta hydrolase [Luteipulveratus sp. YIM 133132]